MEVSERCGGNTISSVVIAAAFTTTDTSTGHGAVLVRPRRWFGCSQILLVGVLPALWPLLLPMLLLLLLLLLCTAGGGHAAHAN